MAGNNAGIGGLPTVNRVIQRRNRVKDAIERLKAYPKDDAGAQAKLQQLEAEFATLNSHIDALRSQLDAIA